jgi:hypothetical protein
MWDEEVMSSKIRIVIAKSESQALDILTETLLLFDGIKILFFDSCMLGQSWL